MTLRNCEHTALRAFREYIRAGYTIDPAGLAAHVAAEVTPNGPITLAKLVLDSPFLLTREPDILQIADRSVTPYALIRANVYEHLASMLASEWSDLQRCEAA